MEKSIFMKKAKWLSFVALLSQIVVFAINSYIGQNQALILSKYGTDVYKIGYYFYYISGAPILMLALSFVFFVGITIMKKPNIGFAVIFAILFGLIFILHSGGFFKPHDYWLIANFDFWTSYGRLNSYSYTYTRLPILLSVAFFFLAIGMIIGGRCEVKDKFKGVSIKISAVLMLFITLFKIVMNFDQKGIATKIGVGKVEEIESWPVYGLLDSTIQICLLVILVMTILANRISKKEGLFAVLISILTTIVIRADYFLAPIYYEILENSVSDRSAFVIDEVNFYIDKSTGWFFNISLILFFIGLGINYASSLKKGLDNKTIESVQ